MRNSSPAFRYALAVLAAIAALFLRELLTPLLGSHDPYESVWLAVVFSAWYCGLGPSIATTLLGILGVWYFFLPPRHSWIVQDPADRYGMLGFLFFSAAIIALGESNRRGLAARSQAEEANKQKEFSARLLELQDQERRRIARELHDGAGQLLAVLSMNAGRVEREKSKLSPETARCAEENTRLIQQVSEDIRTTSYLLHPPLLDEMGLDSALKWYVDGFSSAARSRRNWMFRQIGNGSQQDYELCLFRIAQECLTNIHRHSGGSTARLNLSCSPGEITLEVSDEGKGIPTSSRRLLRRDCGRRFAWNAGASKTTGGHVEIHSNGKGTSVLVTLPLAEGSGITSRKGAHHPEDENRRTTPNSSYSQVVGSEGPQKMCRVFTDL